MTPIRTILLVPCDGDPSELLMHGPLGARPPVVGVCAGTLVYLDANGYEVAP